MSSVLEVDLQDSDSRDRTDVAVRKEECGTSTNTERQHHRCHASTAVPEQQLHLTPACQQMLGKMTERRTAEEKCKHTSKALPLVQNRPGILEQQHKSTEQFA